MWIISLLLFKYTLEISNGQIFRVEVAKELQVKIYVHFERSVVTANEYIFYL